MAGLGGLLSGLGSKFGGALRGAQDALIGNPTFAPTSETLLPHTSMGRNPTAADLNADGLLSVEQPVGLPKDELITKRGLKADGNRSGGLLSGFLSTGEDGITPQDRLFAMGAIMQGDSGGAQQFLSGQKAQAAAGQDRKRREELEAAGLNALRSAIGANGQLDVQQYLANLPVGADPAAGLKIGEALRPDITPMSGPRGAINLFDRSKGAFVPGGIAGEAADPSLFNPDGSVNQNYLKAKRLEAAAVAGGRGEGAAPYRPPRSGGGGRRPAPASLPPDQIQWGKPPGG